MKEMFFAAALLCAVGCSTQDVTPRGQTTSICAIGLPVVAWISHIDNDAEHIGSDTNIVSQANTQSFDGEFTHPSTK